MPRYCFTYGPLMCDDIMTAVAGARGKADFEARYVGYARIEAP